MTDALTQAASSLWDELVATGMSVVAVGARDSDQSILVYLTNPTPKVRTSLPSVHMGYPVRVVRMGRVKPAMLRKGDRSG